MMSARARWCEYMQTLKAEEGLSYEDLSGLLRRYDLEYSASFLCRLFRGARALPADPRLLEALADILSPYDQMPVFFLADRLPSGMGAKLLDAQAEAEWSELQRRIRAGDCEPTVFN